MSLFLNPRSVVLLSAVSLLTSAGCASTSGGTGKPSGDAENVHVGLLVRLEAKPGKEADVQKFLEALLALIRPVATSMLLSNPVALPYGWQESGEV